MEQKDTSLIQFEEKTKDQIARNRSGQSVCMVPSICSKANYCKFKIYEEVIHCLCDTGATVSVIDENLFEKLRQKYEISIESCDPDFLAQAVNGKPLSVKGKVTLMVELGSGTFTHLFYVIKINSDLILGLDFLSKHKASLGSNEPIKSIKEVPFNWSQECDKAFNDLKDHLTKPPILAYPSYDHQFILYTDASGSALGAVLSQSINGKPERVIAYAGRDLKPNETKYSTTEHECLAVVDAVRKFSHYLEGRKFTVITDHNSLRWLMNYKDNNARLQRWALKLQAYDFEIIYRQGRVHNNADSLSRTKHGKYVMALQPNEVIDDPQEDPFSDLTSLKHAQRMDDWGSLIYKYLEDGTLPNDSTKAKRIAVEA